MNLLALDTSTERLCLALYARGQWYPHEEPGGAQASMRLLPAAQVLLSQQGVQWADLHGLAFGQGPGAFTGLRGACAAVQGLALGLGIPAVAVPSVQLVAEDARQQALACGRLQAQARCTVHVAVDARMGQVYDDMLAWDGRRWHSLQGVAVRAPQEVARDWEAAIEAAEPHAGRSEAHPTAAVRLMAGSGLPLLPFNDAQAWRAGVALWAEREVHRALALGHGALAAWEDGPRLDAAQVMPLYVRDRVAQTTAEREAQRMAAAQEMAPVGRGAQP